MSDNDSTAVRSGEMDGRAGRTVDTRTERRWEVEVKIDTAGWVRSSEYGTRERAEEFVKLIGTLHGAKWKKLMRVVEVVAVARTETVVTRTVCSPIAELCEGSGSGARKQDKEPI
jgi:hypothetical protein